MWSEIMSLKFKACFKQNWIKKIGINNEFKTLELNIYITYKKKKE